MTDTFQGWCPLLVKAMGPETASLGEIAGVLSTEASDFQGETLVQEGVDWGYFEKHGILNYNHTPEILGEPREVVRKGSKTLMKGVLYMHVPRAKSIFEAAHAMKKSGATRSYGFSVEGSVLQRDPKDRTRILKARVMNVSVCEHPVNAEARMEVLMKAATVGYQQAAGIDPSFSMQAIMPQSLAGANTTTLREVVRRSWPMATDEECDAVLASILRNP